MGTLFACLHHTLKDKTVGSVNAVIGAKSYSVGQDHLSGFSEMSEISYLL